MLLGWLALPAARPGSTDDVFIVLTYARNLIEQGALAHELGEGRLEGFTSPLDLGFKALLLAVAPGDGLRAAWWGSLALYLTACGACAAVAWRLAGGRLVPALIGLAALVWTPGFAEGTNYLLEVPLVVLTLVVLILRLRPNLGRGELAALTALALAARPELVLVPLVWSVVTPGDHRGRCVSVGSVLGFVTLLRLLLFRAVVPQTFTAKAADERWSEVIDGVRYVADFLVPHDPWQALVALLLCATLAAPLVPAARRGELGLAWLGPVLIAAVVLSGGDGYAGARLLVPALLVGTATWIDLASRSPRAVLVLGLVVLGRAGQIVPTAPAALGPVAGLSLGDYAGEVRALEALSGRLPGGTLASRHLQIAGFVVPELGLLDLTGLNDRSVTRYPTEGPILFGRTSLEPALAAQVEAIHLHHQVLSRRVLARRSVAAWLASPPEERDVLGYPLPEGPAAAALAEAYRTVTLLRAGGVGRHLNLLLRADLATQWEGADGVLVGPSE